jgi:hypothetical protein
MKNLRALPVWILGWLLLAVLATAISGCASTPKPDWDQRIGNYTFDDAVRELGPPVSSIQLQDGSIVAEWFMHAASSMSFGFGTSSYGGGSAAGVGTAVHSAPKAYYRRLTFGPDGKLQRWEKIKR